MPSFDKLEEKLYLKNINNRTVSGNYKQITIVNCSNIIIFGATIRHLIISGSTFITVKTSCLEAVLVRESRRFIFMGCSIIRADVSYEDNDGILVNCIVNGNMRTIEVKDGKPLDVITILSDFEGAYAFTLPDNILDNARKHLAYCSNKTCGYLLNPSYVFIIRKLQEENLLSKKYKKLCCSCYKREILLH